MVAFFVVVDRTHTPRRPRVCFWQKFPGTLIGAFFFFFVFFSLSLLFFVRNKEEEEKQEEEKEEEEDLWSKVRPQSIVLFSFGSVQK